MGKNKSKKKTNKKQPAEDFEIHVDESCLSDSTDLAMPADRSASSETVVHHEPEEAISGSIEEDLPGSVEGYGSDIEDNSPEEPQDEIQDLIDELSQSGSGHEEERIEDPVVDDINEEDKVLQELIDELSQPSPVTEDINQSEETPLGMEEIPATKEDIIEELELPQDSETLDEAVEEAEPKESIATLPADAEVPETHGLDDESSENIELAGIPCQTKADVDESVESAEVEAAVEAFDDTATEAAEVVPREQETPAEIDEELETGHQDNATEIPEDDQDQSGEQEDSFLGSEMSTESTRHDDDEASHCDEEYERRPDARDRAERAEALIQAAARAVVASIEQDEYDNYHEDSLFSNQTGESYDQSASELTHEQETEISYREETELTYDGTETGTYESETEHPSDTGDSSSQHDGDIDDDDVFSHESGHSKRSSWNSSNGVHSGEEAYQEKELTSPKVGEEAGSEELSPIPSAHSYRESTPQTPTASKVLNRPPFRTPSSIRAMQMSSPAPSLFSSPHSTKRPKQSFNSSVSGLESASRRGSDFSQLSASKNKTPTRVFKTKVEHPLVLLHVTVLPLQFQYASVMNLGEELIPAVLSGVKDNWRLLQEKLGEQVLARGILLSHPQDSYEMLEERLLESLELPVRPRAKVLRCGHYMGPDDSTSAEESDNESEQDWDVMRRRDGKTWCDICGRNVQYENNDYDNFDKKFRVKVFASNGLMRAGAWAACWREMERVDVEIEPYIEPHLFSELERLQMQHSMPIHEEVRSEEDNHKVLDDQAALEEEIMREKQQQQLAAEEEAALRRKVSEDRLREIYGNSHEQPVAPIPESVPASRCQSRTSNHNDDSLPQLLLAAFKVSMRDRKNVMIVVLSVLVLILALKPKVSQPILAHQVQEHVAESVANVAYDTMQEAVARNVERVVELPVKRQVVREAAAPVKIQKKVVRQASPPVRPKKRIQPVIEELPEEVDEEEEEEEEEEEVYYELADSEFETKEVQEEEIPTESSNIALDIEAEETALDVDSPALTTEDFDSLELESGEQEAIEQEHYHIEPPSHKKHVGKKVSTMDASRKAVAGKQMVRSGRGVEKRKP